MTLERAAEILNPDHMEHYDSIEPVNEACRMGMEALKTIYAAKFKAPHEVPSNAEVLVEILADVVANGADEEGFSNIPYEEIVYLTNAIGCPRYAGFSKCALDDESGNNPEPYTGCDACKEHWLMEKWED